MTLDDFDRRLSGVPDAGVFRALRAALSTLPDVERAAAASRFRPRLAAWPLAARPVPATDLFEVRVEVSGYFDRDAQQEVTTSEDWLVAALPTPAPGLSLGGHLDLTWVRGVDGSKLYNACEAGGMGHLDGISLDLGALNREGLRPLVMHPSMSGLHTLSLHTARAVWDACRLGPEGAEILGRSRLTSLRTLSVHNAELGVSGAKALRGGALEGLTRLELWRPDLGDAGLVELLTLPLDGLILPDDGLGETAGLALAGAPSLSGLRELRVHLNALTDVAGEAIVKAPFSRTLERLDLSSNQLGARTAAALLAPDALPGVNFLRLFPNPFSDREASALKERYAAVLGPGQADG